MENYKEIIIYIIIFLINKNPSKILLLEGFVLQSLNYCNAGLLSLETAISCRIRSRQIPTPP